MIKPLVIGHSYLLERYSTGQVLRCFFEGLCDRGFEPTILCSKSWHNDVCMDNLKCKVIPSYDCQFIRYIIALAKRTISPDFAFLPDYSYFSWAKISAIPKALKLVQKSNYDYIHSISIPCSTHLIAAEVKKKTGIPWIASFYDPWFENPYRTIKYAWAKERDRKFEKYIADNADLIIHTNHVICEEWVDRYGEEIKKKMVVLPLVFNAPSQNSLAIKAEQSVKENFVISHIGSLYEGRDSLDFLRALALLIKEHPEFADKVKLNYVGTVPNNDKALAEELGLLNMIHYAGFISESECLKFFLESDLYIALDGKNARDIFFPSKIMKYFYYGKPILGLTPKNSVLEHELSKSGNHVFNNSDINGIANFLHQAITKYESISTNDKEYWRNYSLDNVAKQYKALVNRILTK